MSRRLGRSRRWGGLRGSAAPPSLFQQVLALSAGRPVFTADKYVVDGVSGRVRSFVDWNDPAHTLDQPASANQVALPGGTHASFTGAQGYRSTRPASAWAFVHDGVSVEKWDVFTPVAVTDTRIVSTTVKAGAFPGVQSGQAAAGFSTYVGTTGNTLFFLAAGTAGTAAAGVPTYLSLRMQQSAAPQYEQRQQGAVVASGAFATTPDPSPAQTPLLLGTNDLPALQFPITMQWAATLFTPALTPAQRTTVQQWIQAAYSIAP